MRLGHRRKLQREITNTTRLAEDAAFVTPVDNQISRRQEEQAPDLKDESPHSGSSKRDYRHHPKPDLNAPERPYSGYMMFSKDVRKQVKDTSLSFTDISQQVGLSWHSLSSLGKEYWRARATALWQRYESDVTEYRKTAKYQVYMKYLTEFKFSHVTKDPNRSHESRRSSNTGSIPGRSPTAASEIFNGPPVTSSTQTASPLPN